jgi:metallo-beta-lactamase class B
MRGILLIVSCLSVPLAALAQADETSRSWNQPVDPVKIIGNVYYVGASEITAYLITTPEGHILLDGGFEETVPIIQRNVSQLGFKLQEVRILLNSHAHYDHAGGLARLKELTGASLQVSEADVLQMEAGGRNDFAWGERFLFPPARVDRRLRDGDTVSLGGVTLTAHVTPGHTKGCTTWTMRVAEGGQQRNVVFLCSVTAPGYSLANNPAYPNIVSDFRNTFRVVKALPCDVFLAAHGSFFGLREKLEKARRPHDGNPFIDPDGYRDFLDRAERAFENQVRSKPARPSRVAKPAFRRPYARRRGWR